MIRHGRSRYLHHGCRCEVCKQAAREYMRAYRRSKLTGPTATSMAAYNRAVSRLVDRHADEFRRLVDDETAREVEAS